ncbi:MAG: primase C-terminal domain-containing protein [Thermodesulfobacteriota bacterium]
MLEEARIIGPEVDNSSFDRLFPNQDELTGKGLGNLIAIPYQGHAAKAGHTLLLDPATSFTKPFADQLAALAAVKRSTETDLDRIIADWKLEPGSSPKFAEKGGDVNVRGINPADVLKGVPEGQRDETLFKYACRLRAQGRAREEATVLILEAARNCQPPFPEAEALAKIESAWKYPGGQTEGGQEESQEKVKAAVELVKKDGGLQTVLEVVPDLARLSLTDYIWAKHEFKTVLGKSLNLRDLEKAVAAERRKHQGLPSRTKESSALPTIQGNLRQLRDISDDGLQALYRANKPPGLFIRAGMLTRVRQDETGRFITEMINETHLRGALSRAANWIKISAEGKRKPSPPPKEVAADILALGQWSFPPLLGVTEAPVIREDGSAIVKPGYDAATRLYYAPHKLTLPSLPDHPGQAEAERALTWLKEEVFGDFPFESEAAKANTFALLLTPPLRPAINGLTPLAVISAPQAGTGKSLLAELIGVINTGRPAAMMTAPEDEEEWRKRITTTLLAGSPLVCLDNIEGLLRSANLAAVITADTWADRILGRNEMTVLPQRATWFLTGNNVQLGGDLPRRCYSIRLNARMERPWERKVFRHPELLAWVKENRGAILAAMLTMAQAWFLAGRPTKTDSPSIGGFESWCRILGGVLGFAGQTDFLGNLTEMYDAADGDNLQWRSFLESWYERWGERAISVAEVTAAIKEEEAFKQILPDYLVEGLERGEGFFRRRLGKALARKSEVCFAGGLCLKRGAINATHGRAATWIVVKKNEEDYDEI